MVDYNIYYIESPTNTDQANAYSLFIYICIFLFVFRMAVVVESTLFLSRQETDEEDGNDDGDDDGCSGDDDGDVQTDKEDCDSPIAVADDGAVQERDNGDDNCIVVETTTTTTTDGNDGKDGDDDGVFETEEDDIDWGDESLFLAADKHSRLVGNVKKVERLLQKAKQQLAKLRRGVFSAKWKGDSFVSMIDSFSPNVGSDIDEVVQNLVTAHNRIVNRLLKIQNFNRRQREYLIELVKQSHQSNVAAKQLQPLDLVVSQLQPLLNHLVSTMYVKSSWTVETTVYWKWRGNAERHRRIGKTL